MGGLLDEWIGGGGPHQSIHPPIHQSNEPPIPPSIHPMTDFRFAFRQLLKTPGFPAVAVLTLALGIGANTAIFSAVDAVLIRPLPYADADRLVMIWDQMSRTGSPKFFSTPPEWHEWRRSNTVFTDIAATDP